MDLALSIGDITSLARAKQNNNEGTNLVGTIINRVLLRPPKILSFAIAIAFGKYVFS